MNVTPVQLAGLTQRLRSARRAGATAKVHHGADGCTVMLSPRLMFLAGAGLIVLGVGTYVLSGNDWNAAIIGIVLGVAVMSLADIGGGPQPVPAEGYSFVQATALVRRATFGGLTVAMAITTLGFIMWLRDAAGPADVLTLFAISLLVVYASILAAGSLVLIAHMTREARSERGE